jgi:DNA-binding beta-propeller fold protein YncE
MRILFSLLILASPLLAADKVELFASGLKEPFGMDFLDGDMIVPEFGGHRILSIDRSGKTTVLAGSGKVGTSDGVGAAAEFNQPHNLVVAPDGFIYIADTMNHRVRKLNPKTKEVTTLAGTAKGFAGDGGPARTAKFDQAYHVALDPSGKNLLVCDLGNRRIRQINLSNGTISTIIGSGKKAVPVDGANAKEAPLIDPRAVLADKSGRIWILERAGHCLRVVENGQIHTVAGTGVKGNGGDGKGTAVAMDGPKFLWIDGAGDVLIADTENHCIRRYALKEKTLTRIAGTGKKGNGSAGSSPLTTALNRPHGVAIGPDGAMYIADSSNDRILKIAK